MRNSVNEGLSVDPPGSQLAGIVLDLKYDEGAQPTAEENQRLVFAYYSAIYLGWEAVVEFNGAGVPVEDAELIGDVAVDQEVMAEEDDPRLLLLYAYELARKGSFEVVLLGTSKTCWSLAQREYLNDMTLDEDQLIALPVRPYQFLLQVIHEGHSLNDMQLHWPLFPTGHSSRMLFL
jgi:hypothetical protein